MPIFYSLVAKGSLVLVEHFEKPGSYQEIARRLLGKLPAGNDKKSYTYESYTFHYQVEGELVYLCLADAAFGVRIPFMFLNDIYNKFVAKYGTNIVALPTVSGKMAQYDAFAAILRERMNYYSTNPGVDSISIVKTQVEEVKQVMQANIEKVLDRGDKIEVLVDKTENMQAMSFDFKRNTTKLKRKMWWQNKKICVILVFLGLIIISVAVVGGLYAKGIVKLPN